jgi:hypothetical protein
MDLLKQIPPGKEEIPEILLKKLDIAACNLIRNQSCLIDIPEERVKDDYQYEGQDTRDGYDPVRGDSEPFEGSDTFYRYSKWGLLDKWPLQLGDLAIFKGKNTNYWYLGISFGSHPYVMFERGSKEEIFERAEKLNEYRETEGEEVFEDEIMRLIDYYEEGMNG